MGCGLASEPRRAASRALITAMDTPRAGPSHWMPSLANTKRKGQRQTQVDIKKNYQEKQMEWTIARQKVESTARLTFFHQFAMLCQHRDFLRAHGVDEWKPCCSNHMHALTHCLFFRIVLPLAILNRQSELRQKLQKHESTSARNNTEHATQQGDKDATTPKNTRKH